MRNTLARLVTVTVCLGGLWLVVYPQDCAAWNPDVVVSTQSDSIDIVTLVNDPAAIGRLYALLARTDQPGDAPGPDEVAVSEDSGSTWSPLFSPEPSLLGRGGIDLALAESSLCLVETRNDSASSRLIAYRYDSRTGELLYTTVLRDSLISAADVCLVSGSAAGEPYTYIYLAAVVDPGDGPLLFFARSPNGGVTWYDEIDLRLGDIGRIDMSSAPGSEGHILLSYILDGHAYLALNFDCGHSEYWADVYTSLGQAAPNSRPAVAARDSLALVAWELPDGDITYSFSQDAGCTWTPGGLLAATEHHETAPDLAAEENGRFHFLYTDATAAAVLHRDSWSPQEITSWSWPEIVSDGCIWFAPEASYLQTLPDRNSGVGALFVTPESRLVYFDADRPDAAAVGDANDRTAAEARDSGTNAESTKMRFGLCVASPNPAPPPYVLVVRDYAAQETKIPVAVERFSIELLDISGRLVRRLVGPASPLGASARDYKPVIMSWDGKDGGQRPVPPGVYVARLGLPLPVAQDLPSANCRIVVIR